MSGDGVIAVAPLYPRLKTDPAQPWRDTASATWSRWSSFSMTNPGRAASSGNGMIRGPDP